MAISEDTLVIGVASSALFDLAQSHAVFEEFGEDAYRDFQEENYDSRLEPGVAFPFIRRLLQLNDLRDPSQPLVEVVVLSRNDPETGARVMQSIELHGLAMTRAVFTQGRSPFKFMPAFNMKLFLSANPDDVSRAPPTHLRVHSEGESAPGDALGGPGLHRPGWRRGTVSC